MRQLSANIVLCAIVSLHILRQQHEVSASSMLLDAPQQQQQQDSDTTSANQLQQQQQQQFHHSMSCYVCSTMDYENPADNLCRHMNHFAPKSLMHHSIGSGPALQSASAMEQQKQQQQQNYNNHHQTSKSSNNLHSKSSPAPPPSSAPLISDSSEGGGGSATPGSSAMDGANYDDSPAATTTNNNPSTYPPADDTQLVTQTAAATTSSSSYNQNNNRKTPGGAAQGRHAMQPHGRVPPPSSYIRTRPCFDDENFCSIVSVVRIEFKNDSLDARFWAMERNCSKSCNTGCMLIGEKVRLRVCSQCCRTPNCNIGSGARTKFNNFSGLLPATLASVCTSVLITALLYRRTLPEH